MLSFIKKLFSSEALDYKTLMDKGALIVDVRSPAEFAGGHVEEAINIPLGEVSNHILKLKRQNKAIIACCRSGARSGRATTILEKAGIEAYNGGSWKQVESDLAKSQNKS